jgi:DNA-binding response OmpR family regulator
MGLALGAAEYLVKPVAKDDVISAVRRHMTPGAERRILVTGESGGLAPIASVLQSAGYRAVLVASRQDAVRVLEESAVSAMIVDWPLVAGFELLAQARAGLHGRNVGIIVLITDNLAAAELDRFRGYAAVCLQKTGDWEKSLLNRLRPLINVMTCQDVRM